MEGKRAQDHFIPEAGDLADPLLIDTANADDLVVAPRDEHSLAGDEGCERLELREPAQDLPDRIHIPVRESPAPFDPHVGIEADEDGSDDSVKAVEDRKGDEERGHSDGDSDDGNQADHVDKPHALLRSKIPAGDIPLDLAHSIPEAKGCNRIEPCGGARRKQGREERDEERDSGDDEKILRPEQDRNRIHIIDFRRERDDPESQLEPAAKVSESVSEGDTHGGDAEALQYENSSYERRPRAEGFQDRDRPDLLEDEHQDRA